MLEELLADEFEHIGVVCSQLLEGTPVPDQFLNEKRTGAAHPGVPQVDLVDLDEPLLVLAGNGIEQMRIRYAEDCSGRPDSQREREHSHGSETGVLQQLAEGEFEVIHGARPSSDGVNVAVCRS